MSFLDTINRGLYSVLGFLPGGNAAKSLVDTVAPIPGTTAYQAKYAYEVDSGQHQMGIAPVSTVEAVANKAKSVKNGNKNKKKASSNRKTKSRRIRRQTRHAKK